MTYNEIIGKVAEELNLPKGVVDSTYRAYWRAVKDHIAALPLMEDLTDDEFSKLQTNVNIPSIGKLYVTLDRYKWEKERYKKYLEWKSEHSDDLNTLDNSNNLKINKDVTYNKD